MAIWVLYHVVVEATRPSICFGWTLRTLPTWTEIKYGTSSPVHSFSNCALFIMVLPLFRWTSIKRLPKTSGWLGNLVPEAYISCSYIILRSVIIKQYRLAIFRSSSLILLPGFVCALITVPVGMPYETALGGPFFLSVVAAVISRVKTADKWRKIELPANNEMSGRKLQELFRNMAMFHVIQKLTRV